MIGYIVGGLVGIVLVILISRKVACAIPRPSCCQREANKHRKTQGKTRPGTYTSEPSNSPCVKIHKSSTDWIDFAGKADSVNQDNEQNEVTLSLVDEGYMIQSSKV